MCQGVAPPFLNNGQLSIIEELAVSGEDEAGCAVPHIWLPYPFMYLYLVPWFTAHKGTTMSIVNFEAQNSPASTKAGWSVDQWAADVEVSRMTVYNLMNGKVPGAPPVQSVKLGKARRIITTPTEFLAALPRA
jgi:hypothetical protein